MDYSIARSDWFVDSRALCLLGPGKWCGFVLVLVLVLVLF
jgi:hypothetical protein